MGRTDALLTPFDVEREYRIPRGTQGRYRALGLIPFVKVGPRSALYTRASLDEWIADREVTPQVASEREARAALAAAKAEAKATASHDALVAAGRDAREARETPDDPPDSRATAIRAPRADSVRARVEAMIRMDDNWNAKRGDNLLIAELIGCSHVYVGQVRMMLKRGQISRSDPRWPRSPGRKAGGAR